MSTSATYSGSLTLTAQAQATLGTDMTGSEVAKVALTILFAAAGGTAPTISGFFHGTATCAAGDWLLAHASDPLQGMGDAGYSRGFTVAGAKLKLLLIKNTDPTNSLTVARGTNGLPIFDASGDSVTLAPGDVFLFYKPAGTAALTTGSNDKLTISVSAGSPTAEVMAIYGA